MKKFIICTFGVCLLLGTPLLGYAEETVTSTQETTEQSVTADSKTSEDSTYSDESTVNPSVEKEETVTKKDSSQNLPAVLQGEWETIVDGEKHRWIIADKVITSFKTDYQVISWVADGNKYTVDWDIQAYLDKYGAQDFWNTDPFIFIYDSDTNTLEVGPYKLVKKVADIDEDENYVKNHFDKYYQNGKLPKSLHGTWGAVVDGKNSTWIISGSKLNVEGIDYNIIGYGVDGGTKYTVKWDEDSYIATYGKPTNWDPQWFAFTYDADKDTIDVGGNIYQRQQTEKNNQDPSTTNSSKTKKGSILPQTSEQRNANQAYIGVLAIVVSGLGIYFKNKWL